MTDDQPLTKNNLISNRVDQLFRLTSESFAIILAFGFLLGCILQGFVFFGWRINFIYIASTTDVLMSSLGFIGNIFIALIVFTGWSAFIEFTSSEFRLQDMFGNMLEAHHVFGCAIVGTVVSTLIFIPFIAINFSEGLSREFVLAFLYSIFLFSLTASVLIIVGVFAKYSSEDGVASEVETYRHPLIQRIIIFFFGTIILAWPLLSAVGIINIHRQTGYMTGYLEVSGLNMCATDNNQALWIGSEWMVLRCLRSKRVFVAHNNENIRLIPRKDIETVCKLRLNSEPLFCGYRVTRTNKVK